VRSVEGIPPLTVTRKIDRIGIPFDRRMAVLAFEWIGLGGSGIETSARLRNGSAEYDSTI